MSNPYNDKNLFFPLFEDEIKILDNVWNFLDEFREGKITRSKYRKYIIEKIKNKYNINDFYKMEIIVEKMYWNLSSKIKKDHKHKAQNFFKRNF